ncbi:hypothetical protein, conserved in T. vivax, partial [Trypanosoma vivax Y486]
MSGARFFWRGLAILACSLAVLGAHNTQEGAVKKAVAGRMCTVGGALKGADEALETVVRAVETRADGVEARIESLEQLVEKRAAAGHRRAHAKQGTDKTPMRGNLRKARSRAQDDRHLANGTRDAMRAISRKTLHIAGTRECLGKALATFKNAQRGGQCIATDGAARGTGGTKLPDGWEKEIDCEAEKIALGDANSEETIVTALRRDGCRGIGTNELEPGDSALVSNDRALGALLLIGAKAGQGALALAHGKRGSCAIFRRTAETGAVYSANAATQGEPRGSWGRLWDVRALNGQGMQLAVTQDEKNEISDMSKPAAIKPLLSDIATQLK